MRQLTKVLIGHSIIFFSMKHTHMQKREVSYLYGILTSYYFMCVHAHVYVHVHICMCILEDVASCLPPTLHIPYMETYSLNRTQHLLT